MTYQLEVQITVREMADSDAPYGGTVNYQTGLRVEDKLVVDGEGFLAVAAILGRFHELTEALKREVPA